MYIIRNLRIPITTVLLITTFTSCVKEGGTRSVTKIVYKGFLVKVVVDYTDRAESVVNRVS